MLAVSGTADKSQLHNVRKIWDRQTDTQTDRYKTAVNRYGHSQRNNVQT